MTRFRISPVASVILATALPVSAVVASLAQARPVRPAKAHTASAGPAILKVANTSRGKILVNGRGYTLYAFAKDGNGHDSCVKINNCISVWPVFQTNGSPHLGHGVKRSLVGTIKVRGKKQVTYGGHPLYTYSGDTSPRSTSYIGVVQFGAAWPALRVSGKLVH